MTSKVKMNELEKAARGLLYDANYDEATVTKRRDTKRVLHRLNAMSPDQERERSELM